MILLNANGAPKIENTIKIIALVYVLSGPCRLREALTCEGLREYTKGLIKLTEG